MKGPTSFESLKTVEGVVYETFREACEIRGLLENDSHWDKTMTDASTSQMPCKIRHLFAILLTTFAVSNPRALWEKYKKEMCEDILFQARNENSRMTIDFHDDIYNRGLTELQSLCISMSGRSLKEFYMPSPLLDLNSNLDCSEVIRETSYFIDLLSKTLSEGESKLLPEQRTAYEEILSQIDKNEGSLLFLDAPGGTGKTFLINLLLAKIRLQKNVALAVASSGIAPTLLSGGRTAHSALKLSNTSS